MAANKETVGGVYEHPLYYDILFDWNRLPEIYFFDALFQKHGLRLGDRIIEMACGTGLIAVPLARMGWEVTGLDLSQGMLDFMATRCEEEKTAVTALCQDMTDFSVEGTFGAALSAVGSIGLLSNDDMFIRHLQSTAKALQSGGMYIIDLGMAPEKTAPFDYNLIDISTTRDGITIDAQEGFVKVTHHDTKETKLLHWDGVPYEYHLKHFEQLVASSGAFDIETWYPPADVTEEGIPLFDFEIEVDAPDPEEDRAVVVLRKR